MQHYRILSLDGGPSAATTVRCLLAIEQRLPGFLDRTEHFVGSSAGSQTTAFISKRLADARAAGSVDGEAILTEAIDFVEGLFDRYVPPQGAVARLIEGSEAMMGNEEVAEYMQAQLGQRTTLGQLAGRFSAHSTLAQAPWTPVIHANFGPGGRPDGNTVEAIVESGAFPFWLPARRGHVDGAMLSNDPQLMGLTAALEAAPTEAERQALLGRAVLFSWGALDGSSDLSNRYTPMDGEPMPQLPEPGDVGPGRVVLQGVEDAADLADRALSFAHQLGKDLGLFGSEDGSSGTFDAAGNESWGWRQWLAYPRNLCFLLQIWMNSEGRGNHRTASALLPGRALRAGPVTYLGSNEAFLMLFLGQTETIYSFAEFTANLWVEDADGSRHGFRPSFDAVVQWLERHWMLGPPSPR